MAGAEKAYQFLTSHGFGHHFAECVKSCIEAHRFRTNCQPQSIEAKILFDADKLEVTGAIGMARTLLYEGAVGEPLYSLQPDGQVSDGTGDTNPSFFQEYKYKLEHIYDKFYTQKGKQLAKERQEAAARFYKELYQEVDASYRTGLEELKRVVC